MRRKQPRSTPLSLFAFQDIIMSVTGVFLLLIMIMVLELSVGRVSTPDAASRFVASELKVAIDRAQRELVQIKKDLTASATNADDVGKYTQASAESAIRAMAEQLRLLKEGRTTLRVRIRELETKRVASEEDLNRRSGDVDKLEILREERRAIEAELTELRNSQRVFYRNQDSQGRRVFIVELTGDTVSVAEAGVDKPPQLFSGSRRGRAFVTWAGKQGRESVRFVIIVHRGQTELFKSIHLDLRSHGHSVGFDLLPDDARAVDREHGAG